MTPLTVGVGPICTNPHTFHYTTGKLPRPSWRLRDLSGHRSQITATELIWHHQLSRERAGLRPTAICSMNMATRLFARSLEPRSLLSVQAIDIEEFLDTRQAKIGGGRIKNSTRSSWLTRLFTFYEWARAEGLIETNPAADIRRPRVPRLVPRPIDSDDLERAYEGARGRPRLRATLALAAYEGLRCLELSELNREDILDTRNPPVIVVTNGKGATQRIVPLHPEALAALNALPLPESGPVLRGLKGERLSSSAIGKQVRLYFHRIGVEASAHRLRHWFATETYAQTKDLRLTQALLGHASPSTTAGYVGYSADDAATAVAGLSIGQGSEFLSARSLPNEQLDSPSEPCACCDLRVGVRERWVRPAAGINVRALLCPDHYRKIRADRRYMTLGRCGRCGSPGLLGAKCSCGVGRIKYWEQYKAGAR